MSQIVLNNCQACWLIQLTSYDFTIQYCWDSLNSADESSWRSDYMQIKQSEKYHESDSMLINSERHCELNFKQSQLTSIQNNSSSLISVENKLTWQIDDLISILVNKLATVTLRMSEQYSCCIRETDSETKCLIWVLSLQAITWSKVRLTADDLVSYRETFNSFNQKTVFLSIFISESTSYSSLNLSEKNMTILSLIKNTQEFNSQCRQISNQLCEKSEKNFSFVLHKNEILRKTDCVYIFHQKMIWN